MQIFDIHFDKYNNMGEVVDKVLKTENPISITTPNNEFLLASLNNPRVTKIVNESDMRLSDSTGLFMAFALADLPNNSSKIMIYVYSFIYMIMLFFVKSWYFYPRYGVRISGTDFVDRVSRLENKKIYIIGSSVKSCEGFKKKYNQEVYYKTWEDIKEKINTIEKGSLDYLVEEINIKNIDYVYIAMGAPESLYLQERLLPMLPKMKFIISCGGAIDYLGGGVSRAPYWMRVIGLEWLYRLFRQPLKRTKRVFKAVFIFWWEVVQWKLKLN